MSVSSSASDSIEVNRVNFSMVLTALATAVLASRPAEDCQTERERLARQALDLGEAGRDPVFGFGLMSSLFNEN